MIGKMALGAAVTMACAMGGCASAYPPPTQRMAEAMAAIRGAEEVGANNDPQGHLHLRLAQEALQNAKILADGGDNKRADFVLIRAKADAELALAEAREGTAIANAEAALRQATAMRSAATNIQPASPMATPPAPVVPPSIAPAAPAAPAAPPAPAPPAPNAPNGGVR
jgi:hypothetical protein